MNAFILVIVLATSHSAQSGAASVVHEFTTQRACLNAGEALVLKAKNSGSHILTWGCVGKEG